MNDVQELIDELRRSDVKIVDALIKAQVLAHSLSNSDLATWVESELVGYQTEDVPEYRKIRMTITGVLNDGYRLWPAQPIITFGILTEEEHDKLTTRHATESISAIELHAKMEAEGKQLAVPLSAERCIMLSKPYEEPSHIQKAWAHPPLGASHQILTEVRTRLLKFALALIGRLPESIKSNEIKDAVPAVDVYGMFRHAVIGDNNTFVFSNSGTVTGASTVIQNDFASLAAFLEKQGVPRESVADLGDAIMADQVAIEKASGDLGKRVRSWLDGFGKIAGTATISAAAKVAIEHALHLFYGH